jgi:hypothetical protein
MDHTAADLLLDDTLDRNCQAHWPWLLFLLASLTGPVCSHRITTLQSLPNVDLIGSS